MASRGGITVKIDGQYDDAQVNKAIRDLEKLKTGAGATTASTGALSKAAIGMGAAFAATMSIGAVTDFLKDAAAAAIADEKSVVALSQAMSNLGLASKNAVAEDFIHKLMLATGVADDQLRPAFQRLVTATGDVALSQKSLRIAMDISAATGRSLESVTLALTKASQGQLTGLQRLGVPLSAGVKASKDYGAALDELSAKFAGQATAETFALKIQRITTAVDEARETIGYALLGAMDTAAKSMGGTDGLVGQIDQMGKNIAVVVTGLGNMSNALISLSQANAGGNETGASLADLTKVMSRLMPVSGALANMWGILQQQAESTAEATSYMGTTMSSGKIMSLNAAEGLLSVRDAADKASGSMSDLNDELKGYLGLISVRQAQADFRQSLIDLGDTLKGNARSFKGSTDAIFENQQSLRTALADNVRNVQQWGEQVGATPEQVQARIDRGTKRIVQAFIDNGFKRKDILDFLGSEGLWTDPATDRARAMGAAAIKEARAQGILIGKDLAAGIRDGLISPEAIRGVSASSQRLIAQAEFYARQEAESHSPSMLFARVGEDLSAGVAVGIERGKGKAAAAMAAVMGATLDAAKDVLAKGNARLDSALGAVQGISDGILSQIMGGVGFGSLTKDIVDELGNSSQVALSPQELVQALFGTQAKQQDVVDHVAQNIGTGLPPALLDQILSLPPDTAIALADYLGANPALIAELTANYQALSDSTQTLLGVPMGIAWGKVGDQSAKEMLLAARELIKERRDTFTAWVAQSLAVDIPVTFHASGGNLPGRANGGPVAGGMPYIVGERGPELFVPQASGSIVPNSRMGGAGGNTYNISVQAGVGDPRQIGQQIVEYVRKFEKANGSVWAAA